MSLPKAKLDELFDYLTYGTVGVCFIGSIIFILKAIHSTLNGWSAVSDYLWSAGILIGFGIVVSLFLFYIKSWGEK